MGNQCCCSCEGPSVYLPRPRAPRTGTVLPRRNPSEVPISLPETRKPVRSNDPVRLDGFASVSQSTEVDVRSPFDTRVGSQDDDYDDDDDDFVNVLFRAEGTEMTIKKHDYQRFPRTVLIADCGSPPLAILSSHTPKSMRMQPQTVSQPPPRRITSLTSWCTPTNTQTWSQFSTPASSCSANTRRVIGSLGAEFLPLFDICDGELLPPQIRFALQSSSEVSEKN